MKILIITLINLLTISLSYVLGLFLKPNILENHPVSFKIICESSYLAYQRNLYIKPTSYINCVNNAIIKINSATLRPSTPSLCPLQFANFSKPFDCPNGIRQWDVTSFLKELCNNKEECEFIFGELPSLSCECFDDVTKKDRFDQPRYFQYLNVSYHCQTNRMRFRPFANRRYNPKFRVSMNHPFRKYSYNHLRMI